jgi:Protein of unknown function (DUF1579)
MLLGMVASGMAQQHIQNPDLEKQRTAMKKLHFLTGTWFGEAHVLRGPGDPVTLTQIEEVQYKLDGLVLVIEGTGRTPMDQTPVVQALGIISYDDATGSYRIRAWVDGRMLESDVQLLDDGKSLRWGFGAGDIRTRSLLKVEEDGRWTEVAEVTIGSQPAKKLMDLTVRRT